jgi:N-acetylglucosamine kinase-like BadF-type ATPase
MNIILGIDQGGTKTMAVVCSEDGRLLSVGRSAGAYHLYDGMPVVMKAAKEACLAALTQADLKPVQVISVYGGFTGVDWPDEYGLFEENVRGLGLCDNVHITNDSIIALRGGTENSYGAILVAGTGANCAVRAPDGRVFIYHYYHEDELQGGGALGRHALRTIFRAHVGLEPPTSLSRRVLAFYGLRNVDELKRGIVEERIASDTIKELAPIIFEEAFRGDQAAACILRHFGEGCAAEVVNGLSRLNMLDLDVEVVLSGSIFKGIGPLLIDVLTASIHMAAPKARLVNARFEPVVGAALLGLEDANIQINESIKENIEKTANQLKLIRTTDRN